MFGTAMNNAQFTNPLTSDIHDSKHAFVPKAVCLFVYLVLLAKGGHFKHML